MKDEDFALLAKSGLRRLLIGVESGSQEMMDWMQKDIKLE
ncbi:MAG: anaerobic magnesium-protoporphyrin IX monomethyl ester cyclase [Granulosicoccus sp.]|jgi:anaerobic magnesium-protoporphyrin IX monomethyl ester cyclase